MTEYLDKVIRTIVLILPKMIRYVKTFKVKDNYNKLMFFRINDEKLWEKYRTIWTQMEHIKNFELNAFPVYENRYLKSK